MGAFAIYAFVVTGLYILYMSAVIMKDLFGKKGQKKDVAEEFNTADIGEETSTVIDETEDGFHVHQSGEVVDDTQQEPTEEHSEDSGSSVSHQEPAKASVSVDSFVQDDQEQPVDENPDDETLLEEESEASQAEYERLIAVKKEMLSIKPSYQDEYLNEEYRVSTAKPLSEQSRILCNMVGNL